MTPSTSYCPPKPTRPLAAPNTAPPVTLAPTATACYHRDLDTRVGTVDVAVPTLRQGSYFPDWLLDHRTRERIRPDQCRGDRLPERRVHLSDG